MPSFTRITTLSALVVLALSTPQHADAHGKLLKPEAILRKTNGVVEAQQYDFVGEIKGKDVFPPARGQSWSSTPQKNQQLFQTTFTANGFTTLRQFFQAPAVAKLMKPRFPGKTDNVCGFTDATAAAVELPQDGVLEWGNKAGKWGFQNDHHGPCEVWCDDNLVLQNADCRGTYGKELPARMTIDVAQCTGAKRLQFLWLAVHFAKWQYWLNCVPLVATAAPVPTAMPAMPAMPTVPGVMPVKPVANVTDPTTPYAPSATPVSVPSAVPMPIPASAAATSTSKPMIATPPVPAAVPTATSMAPVANPVVTPVVVPAVPAVMPVTQPMDAAKQQAPLAPVMPAPELAVDGGQPTSNVATNNKNLYAQFA